MKLIKGEEIIRQIRFKGFGNGQGKDEITLTNKRVILKTVTKDKAMKITEKHMDVKTVSGITVASERHFNIKGFLILMIAPLLGVAYAVWQTFLSATPVSDDNLIMYAGSAFLVFAILGVLIFRRAYVGIGIMLKAVVDPTEEGAMLELTGRAYRDKKETISTLVQEVMTLATGGTVQKKVEIKIPDKPVIEK